MDRRGSYFASIGYSLVVVNRIVDASPISPRAIRQVRGLLKAFEGVGILAHEEHVRGGMRIAFGVTLISLLKGSQVWYGKNPFSGLLFSRSSQVWAVARRADIKS